MQKVDTGKASSETVWTVNFVIGSSRHTVANKEP